MQFRQTSNQVARAARPDAVDGPNLYLIKSVDLLRLTYQIRLLTYMSAARGQRLWLVLPTAARLSADLRTFLRENNQAVGVKRSASLD